jgi:hypothetical protein
MCIQKYERYKKLISLCLISIYFCDLSAVVDDSEDWEEEVAGQRLQQHRAGRVRREVHQALNFKS